MKKPTKRKRSPTFYQRNKVFLKKKENKNKTLKVPKPFFRGYKSGMDLSTKNFI